MFSSVIDQLAILEPTEKVHLDAMQVSDSPFTPTGPFSHFTPRDLFASNGYPSVNNTAPRITNYASPPHIHQSVYPPLRFSNMEPLSREELERFQKLSNEYEPQIQVR